MFAAEFEPAVVTTRRRSPRAPVSLDAQLGKGGLGRALCKVVDLSMHGVKIQTYGALKRDSMLWLTIPTLGARAVRVMRSDDYEAGCEFLDPLTQAEFDAVVELDGTLRPDD